MQEEQAVRSTPDATRAGDWAVVLASAGVPHRLVERDGAFAVVVTAADAGAAAAALDAYEAENVPVVVPPVPDLGPSVLGVVSGALLLAFFLVTGGTDGPRVSPWFGAGNASSELILHGQWWRAVTTLTLHADLLHLVGNVIAALLFFSAVGRWLGAGLGGLFLLVASAAANLLTAVARGPGHASVGASTATFAALGMLAGLQALRWLRHGARRKYAWVPLAAGLGLYAMLGVGEQVDMLAHLFGLGAGALAGGLATAAGVRAPGRALQALLGIGGLAALAGCWLLAFRA
jgi:membrane associated rhomboid family serine protease